MKHKPPSKKDLHPHHSKLFCSHRERLIFLGLWKLATLALPPSLFPTYGADYGLDGVQACQHFWCGLLRSQWLDRSLWWSSLCAVTCHKHTHWSQRSFGVEGNWPTPASRSWQAQLDQQKITSLWHGCLPACFVQSNNLGKSGNKLWTDLATDLLDIWLLGWCLK